MRNLILGSAAVASSVAMAVPAAAQYYPQPRYGQDQNNGYGYNNGSASFRNLQVRIDRLQQRIRELDARNMLTNEQARQRFNESRIIERQLHNLARDGLSRRETYDLERGLSQFEQQVRNDMNGGRGWARDGRRDDWSDRDDRDYGDDRDDRYQGRGYYEDD